MNVVALDKFHYWKHLINLRRIFFGFSVMYALLTVQIIFMLLRISDFKERTSLSFLTQVNFFLL